MMGWTIGRGPLRMPKRATPLKAKQLAAIKDPGMYADGHGLYLHVGPDAKSRSWIFRYQLDGRRRDMGLGPVDLVPLAAARNQVLDLRRGVRGGIDPLEAKRQEKAIRRAERANAITFKQAAIAYIEA